jgi:hypothetical protein
VDLPEPPFSFPTTMIRAMLFPVLASRRFLMRCADGGEAAFRRGWADDFFEEIVTEPLKAPVRSFRKLRAPRMERGAPFGTPPGLRVGRS